MMVRGPVMPVAPVGPLNPRELVVFPAAKLVPLLRAIADPEGKGELSQREAELIDRIEGQLADTKQLPRASRDDG